MWIPKQSSMRCGVTRLGHPMDTILPMLNENFSGNAEELAKVSWSQRGNEKVIYTDNSLEFGKSCEDLLGINLPSTPHWSETHWVAEREQCAKSRKGHLRYCCNQVWTKNGGRIPWSAAAICETWEDTLWKAIRNTILMARLFRLVRLLNITLFMTDLSRLPQIGPTVLPGTFFG